MKGIHCIVMICILAAPLGLAGCSPYYGPARSEDAAAVVSESFVDVLTEIEPGRSVRVYLHTGETDAGFVVSWDYRILVIGNTGRNGVVKRTYERQEISDIELVARAPEDVRH